jgi:ATP-dependent Lhr-like helicase
MVFHLFSERLQELIKKKGFLEPTAPQKLGIPEILSGKNVLIISPTGVGKTEACILPLLDKIKNNNEKPIALLYITPLRALNRDLLDRLFWWADNLEIDIDVRHGDTSKKERNEQRENPSHILITTPETLGAILPGKRMREHLKNVKYVIIDEIHELVENKRGVQLSLLLERLERIAGNFQRIALSATVGEPNKVARFLGSNVKIINADTEKRYEIKIELPNYKGNEVEGRILRIKELINQHNKTLIFTNTRETAEALGSRFKLIEKDFQKIDVHHGSLSKNLRIKAENTFKKGELKALIATSSLELGIDIGEVDFVIQYLSPRRVSKLLQRFGRSGHKIGEISKGVIISDKDDLLESCIIAKNAGERKIEGIKIHELALDILATQIVGMTLDEYEISLEDAFLTIRKAYPYRNMKKEDFISLINFLREIKLIYVSEDGKRIKRRKKGWKYYYENLSSIPDLKKISVIDVSKNETIGFLDESFVLEHGEIGNTFICAGSAWKIIQIEGTKVFVEYIEDIESAIPAWEGELIPVSFEVAQDVGKLRKFIYKKIETENKNVLKDFLIKKYNINDYGAKVIIKTILKQKDFVVPDHETIFIESFKDFVIIHSCFGNNVNNTIGRYIASMLAMTKGESVNVKVDPYRIIIRTFSKIDEIIKIILNANDLRKVIEISLEDSSLFKWNFFQIAKRFGIISPNATIDSINLKKIINQYKDHLVYIETIRTILKEKMDIEKTEEIINKIKRKEIRIVKSNKKISPLGKSGLERLFFDVIKPKRPEREIFENFKRRLFETRIRIVCMNCKEYSVTTEVKDLEEYPTCPKCNSRLIGIYDYSFKKDPLDLLKKKNLTKEEKKEIERLRRSASLMITYGKKYAIVQAGRGIGVETAARILSKLPKDEESLLKYIFEAEKSYVKYRKFWKL